MPARRTLGALVLTGALTAGLPAVPATAAPAVDLTAPTASVTKLARFTAATSVTVRYSGSDSGSGVKDYDVRVRSAAKGEDFGPLYSTPAGGSQRTSTSLRFTPTAGTDYCFSVRARDDAGNVSPWTADTCTAVALDDRGLTASRGWTRSRSSAAYRGTVTRSSTYRSALSATVRGRRIALVVTTCATCGPLAILLDGTYWRTVKTYSAKTVRRVVLVQPGGSKVVTSTITLAVASDRPVLVDGLAIAAA